ncbi:hypothetical protein HQ587_03760 [bacterium]|nr:hypothetical protein [bacterium]
MYRNKTFGKMFNQCEDPFAQIGFKFFLTSLRFPAKMVKAAEPIITSNKGIPSK